MHQQDVDHRGLVDHEKVAVERIIIVAFEPAALGSTSSSRWMVLASMPVASFMRLAARPVGAHSAS